MKLPQLTDLIAELEGHQPHVRAAKVLLAIAELRGSIDSLILEVRTLNDSSKQLDDAVTGIQGTINHIDATVSAIASDTGKAVTEIEALQSQGNQQAALDRALTALKGVQTQAQTVSDHADSARTALDKITAPPAVAPGAGAGAGAAGAGTGAPAGAGGAGGGAAGGSSGAAGGASGGAAGGSGAGGNGGPTF